MDTVGYDYPEPLVFPTITAQEIEDAIRKPGPDKAPGPDGITNRILVAALPALIPTLTQLFNRCLELGHHPPCFKESITVALTKPGKGDYGIAKAYRPIALLNTIGKALESVVSARLNWAVEQY